MQLTATAILQYPTLCHGRWKVRTFANVDVELLATGHQGRNLLLQRGCKLTGYVALLVQPCKPKKQAAAPRTADSFTKRGVDREDVGGKVKTR